MNKWMNVLMILMIAGMIPLAILGLLYFATEPVDTHKDKTDIPSQIQQASPSPVLIGDVDGVQVSGPSSNEQTRVAISDDQGDVLEDIGRRKAGVDWPGFLGATGDSRSTETGILTNWNSRPLKQLWKLELGTSYGIGSIAQGRYYQFDRVDDECILWCLDAERGKPLWKFIYKTQYEDLYGYNNGPRCSPLIDGNRVYIYGVAGHLYCLNATSGKEIWHVDTNKQYGVIQNFFGVGSTPVIDGDLLICMVGGSPAASQSIPPGQLDLVKANGSAIVALNKYTGKQHYKIGNDLASYASPRLTTVNNRRWCLVFARGGLIGLEPQSGVIDFEYPWQASMLESVNASTPVVVGDEVFISETYGPGSSLVKIASGKSEVVWKDELDTREKAMQAHWNTPIYVDGFLYGCSGRHTRNAELRCIEWKTGKVQWSVPGLTRTSLTYIDGHFVCQGEYGHVFLIKANPAKFEPVAGDIARAGSAGEYELPFRTSFDISYPCWAAPVVSHGLMYLRGDHSVICLELIAPEK
ncbi:MAG: PQQ-binding-like beta-propeller repeat protein [Planctomycetota bacterium]|nr:PQQ-binding-like beta-propeller repeat protein [Planctomycetota bacterium]